MNIIAGVGALCVVFVLFLKSQFWMRQPIRHFYDCASPMIISKKWTKYCDHRVTTFKYEAQAVDALVEFIKTHAEGYPNESHVRAYLPGAHVSVFVDDAIKGAILSRPVHFAIDTVEQPAEMYEFWVGDNGQSLLCTHEHNRPNTPAIFAKNHSIPMLVPMVKYPVYWVSTAKYRSYKADCIKITASTIMTLRNRLVNTTFRCRIVPSVERLLELVENKVFSAFCTPETTYVFKNNMNVEKNRSILDLVAVIGKNAYPAFSTLVYRARNTYGWVRIHGLSDYNSVNRKQPDKQTMRYVYTYNYYSPRIKAEDCLIL